MTRSPWLNALIHPLNLAMLALSVVSGLCAAWWMFPIGLLLWLLMFIFTLRDPVMRMQTTMQAREPLAQRFQQAFDRIERGQVRLFQAITQMPGNLQRTLQPILKASETLVDEAYWLCQRMTVLENHRLVTRVGNNLRDQIADTEYKLNQATDAQVRAEYQQSLNALRERMANLVNIEAQLDRAEALLASLTAEMDNLLTQVVRLRNLPAAQAQERIEQAAQKLNEEIAQVQAIQ